MYFFVSVVVGFLFGFFFFLCVSLKSKGEKT